MKLAETGNLYFETAEKTRPENPKFIESGILRNDNSWLYAIGNYTVVYVFSKKRLQRIWRHRSKYPWLVLREAKIGTSKGFTMPEAIAKKGADRILHPSIRLVKG